ncbi:MAG: GNAT family N-acetyltransferase [Limnohabitans sp.]|nr:GNAT family N-acetyltransferase [Limnohabitans sp.]
MKAEWGALDMAAWDQAHAAAAPLQQDWAYGSTMVSIGARVMRARIEADGVPVALAQFIVRKFAKYVSLALCTRGPLWLQALSPADKATAYKALRKSLPVSGLRLMMVTPDESLETDTGLPYIRRVMSGYSTVMLDIDKPMEALRAQLDKRWRHRLGGAEKSELNVQRMGTNPGQYRWLLDAEMQQRVDRGLEGMPPVFFERYAESRKQPSLNMLSMRADVGRERVAGMMFLIHGQAATYQVGWTSDAGRDLHAHNLMLWRAIEELRGRGVCSLDLGGVNTQRSAGVARFKMATGGTIKKLAGSYLL